MNFKYKYDFSHYTPISTSILNSAKWEYIYKITDNYTYPLSNWKRMGACWAL